LARILAKYAVCPVLWVDIYVNPDSVEELVKMLKLYRRMGYSAIGVDRAFLKRHKKSIASLGEEVLGATKVRLLPTAYIKCKGEREAKALVRKAFDSGCLIIGSALDLSAFRFFSRDSRVRVVELKPKFTMNVDRNEALLLKTGSSALGINLSYLLRSPAMMSWLSTAISRVLKYSISLVLYSGAKRWNELWHPRQVYSLFESLGFHGRQGLLALRPFFMSK